MDNGPVVVCVTDCWGTSGVAGTSQPVQIHFPSAVFLEKITGWKLVEGLAMQLAWVVFFIVVCRAAYARGVRRYSGYGG